MQRLLLVFGVFLFTAATAASQTGRIYRLAIIASSGPVSALSDTGRLGPVFQELRRLGYVEGQNLIIERRSAEDRPDHLPNIVREVAALRPDVILTTSGRVLLQIKAATSTIPAVGSTSDPVGYGLAVSLARPGGNITGITADAGTEILGKRLQLLRDIVPGIRKVAYLTPRDGWENIFGAAVREAAGRLGLDLIGAPLEIPISEAEYHRVFAALAEQRPDAILVSDYNENMSHRHLIVELARVHRLPALYPFREFIEAGGMVAYAPDLSDMVRHFASAVDAILRGTNPGDIPFYQPTRFLLTVNLKSASEIGIEISPALLSSVDEVIEQSNR